MTVEARYRERPVINDVGTWAYSGYASTTPGDCFDPPGPMTRYIPSWSGSGSYVASYITDSMTDYVTSDFYRLQAEGKIINNPMTKSYESITRELINFSWLYKLQSGTLTCDPPKYVEVGDYSMSGTRDIQFFLGESNEFLDTPDLSDDIEDQMDICVNRSYSEIGADQTLAIATVAEMDETVVGLTFILSKVLRVLRSIRRADLRALNREITSRELTQTYMAARYTLRPLYYDTKGLINVFTNNDKPGRRTFRASSHIEGHDSDMVNDILYSDYYITCGISFARSSSYEVKTRAGVLTHAQKANLAQLMGLDSLVETSWELIPFSFIIDWFSNVGDTICAWTPKLGFHILTSWVTVDTTITQATVATGPTLSYQDNRGYTHRVAPTYNCSGGRSERVVKTFTRVPNRERSALPTFSVNLDPYKILDLAIIVQGLISGSRLITGRR